MPPSPVRAVVGPDPGRSGGPVAAVLLDMDDTIFDHSLTCRAAIASLRSANPYLRRRPLNELWQEYLTLLDAVSPGSGGRSWTADQARRERWRRLALSCGAELSGGQVAELSQTYRERYQRLRRPVPGARELVARLHSFVPVVIVTNNEVAEQEEKVRFLGVGPWIDGLVVSEAVGVAKPDPRIFAKALASVGVPAEQATMLGDSWTSDVQGSAGAGLRPVWFNRFHRPRPEDRPVDEIRSLRPLRPAESLLLGRAAASSAGPRPPGPSEL